MLPVRVLAVVAVASIAFVPQAALAGGCAPDSATTSGLAGVTTSGGRAFSAVPDALTIAYRMVSTKDASVIVFNRAEDADDYTGAVTTAPQGSGA